MVPPNYAGASRRQPRRVQASILYPSHWYRGLNPASPTLGGHRSWVAAQGPCSKRWLDAGFQQPGSLVSHRCASLPSPSSRLHISMGLISASEAGNEVERIVPHAYLPRQQCITSEHFDPSLNGNTLRYATCGSGVSRRRLSPALAGKALPACPASSRGAPRQTSAAPLDCRAPRRTPPPSPAYRCGGRAAGPRSPVCHSSCE